MKHLIAGALLLALAPFPTGAQQPAPTPAIRQQQDELERVRREREALRKRMEELKGTVHDLSEEVTNLDRQAAATARLVKSLDVQLISLGDELATQTGSLVRAEDELAAKRAILQRRLTEIYKRGPLFTAEVLLSAQSFGELIARYKYLHTIAQSDRALVANVQALRDRISKQRNLLVTLRSGLERNRAEKAEEEERLRDLEERRTRSLANARQAAKRTQARLVEIERTEARLNSVIGSFEAARRSAERRTASAPAASTLRTSDLGQLAWPVDGTLLYRFGRVVNPNNTTTRWNGIGIAAPMGTPVRSIAAGQIVLADRVGTYGTTVIVQHGGGDYSIYGSLSRMDVSKGMSVRKGQQIGLVGAADPELEPHLHFEIRRAQGVAVDPLEWLRGAR